MSRLIDADKILKQIDDDLKITSEFIDKSLRNDNECKFKKYAAIRNMLKSYRAIVKDMPTAFDVDDILRQCKDKAIQLMNKQYNEDEYHMFSKGVQAMYLGVEKIVKRGEIDED